jgi:hypothetical protein
MSEAVTKTVTHLPSGGTCTTFEWESGTKAYFYSIPDAFVSPSASMPPRYQPGDAGYQRALRIIDAQFDDGQITAREATQREEDYVTESDRAERS